MFLAQEFDATEDGRPYVSAERPRIIYPNLRARLYGYLTTAPQVRPGFRTDGVWAWPEALARHVKVGGAAPQWQFYSHLKEQHFLLPDAVPPEALTAAARACEGPPVPDTPVAAALTYLANGESVHRVAVGGSSPGETAFVVDHWEPGNLFQRATPREQEWADAYHEVSPSTAAQLVGEHCDRILAQYRDRARESDQDGDDPQWARVYDGEAADGSPWFSPGRMRIPEPVRRERLATYLSSGRLVLRTAGRMPDPLEPERGPVVPMSYRTDGSWLWPDALAYHLERHGVAPELDLLCHIEERGYRPPVDVAEDAVAAAIQRLRGNPPPTLARPRYVYHHDGEGIVARALDGDVFRADALGWDLEWTDTEDLSRQRYRGSDYGFEEITEAAAVRIIDEHWADLMDGRELD